MLQFKYILIFFVAGISLGSCKSYYTTFAIENAKPNKGELPPEIQSVTLMNRSMNDQFVNYQEDSIQAYFYRNGYQLSKIALDSAASDTTIRALAALLFESGRYDVVVPLERNIQRLQPYYELPDTLNPSQVAKICSDYNTDALMVLERFYTKIMADYSAEKYTDPNVGYSTFYNASLDLKYDAIFRLYKPGKKTLFKEYQLIDTINWEGFEYSQEQLFSKLPSVKQAIISAGIKIALDLDATISPSWIREKRGYFLIKSRNDSGDKLMTESKYDEAGKYWTELAESNNKNIRSKAEYNLALINELNGDIDAAINWGLKSFYTKYRFQTEVYLKKLQARKEALKNSPKF
jgi:hypothetical protein